MNYKETAETPPERNRLEGNVHFVDALGETSSCSSLPSQIVKFMETVILFNGSPRFGKLEKDQQDQ